MVALRIAYERVTDDKQALVVRSVEELDTLVERVLARSRDSAVPSMVMIFVDGDVRAPSLSVGLGVERGFVYYMARDGGYTCGDPSLSGHVVYDYLASRCEIPAGSEVAIAEVRRRLREFMQSGAVPQGLWLPPE